MQDSGSWGPGLDESGRKQMKDYPKRLENTFFIAVFFLVYLYE